MHTFRDYIRESGIHISDKDWDVYSAHITSETFKKGDIITKQGEIENYINFIVSGISIHYIEHNDMQTIINFSFDNTYSCSYESFITHQPSECTIEALTNIEMWRLTYDDFQYILKNAEIGPYIEKYSIHRLYLRKSARERSFLIETAEERYLNLIKMEPNIFLKISLKYIASYIGVTPQALSRIRKRIVL